MIIAGAKSPGVLWKKMKLLMTLLYVHSTFSCSILAVGATSRDDNENRPSIEACSIVVMARSACGGTFSSEGWVFTASE